MFQVYTKQAIDSMASTNYNASSNRNYDSFGFVVYCVCSFLQPGAIYLTYVKNKVDFNVGLLPMDLNHRETPNQGY